MRFLLALRSLPFLPIKFAPPQPQPAELVYGNPRPQFARRANISTVTESSTDGPITTTLTVLTFVTPSPSAPAIPITSQSQIITSYVPKLTICPIASYGAEPWYKKRQEPTSNSTYDFSNFSISATPEPSCSVLYSPTISPICHTTLTPLGGIPITVTACNQKIAFGTDYGFYTPSPNGSVTLVPTTYTAAWKDVITGVPTGVVEAAVSQDGLWTTFTESWYAHVFGAVSTTSSVVDVSAIITGPQEVLVPPTYAFTISGPTPSTISISTTFDVVQSFQSTIIIQDTYQSGPPPLASTSNDSMPTTIYLTSTSTRFITIATATATVMASVNAENVNRQRL